MNLHPRIQPYRQNSEMFRKPFRRLKTRFRRRCAHPGRAADRRAELPQECWLWRPQTSPSWAGSGGGINRLRETIHSALLPVLQILLIARLEVGTLHHYNRGSHESRVVGRSLTCDQDSIADLKI